MSKKTMYACLYKPKLQQVFNNYLNDKHNTNPTTQKALKAAFAKEVQWTDNYTIKVGFFRNNFLYNGNSVDPEFTIAKAAWVKFIVEKYFINTGMVNLSFKWDVDLIDSDIRISFVKEMGAFSELGTNALEQPKSNVTMNLGWLDRTEDDSDYEGAIGKGSVVVHEFGHALGLIHEHSREDVTLNWDKNAVYKRLGGPPNSWTEEDCNNQIFAPAEFDQSNSSVYDPNSIMHYYFPNEYFKQPFPNIKQAVELSELDIQTIKNRYPGGGGKSIGNIKGLNNENNENNENNKNNISYIITVIFNKYWFFILVIFIVILLLLILKKKNII